jgi:hypothetical protein
MAVKLDRRLRACMGQRAAAGYSAERDATP